MKTVRIPAAQTPEFRNEVEAALQYAIDATAHAEAQHASLLCFPECFLQGYLTDEAAARQVAVYLESAAFLALCLACIGKCHWRA